MRTKMDDKEIPLHELACVLPYNLKNVYGKQLELFQAIAAGEPDEVERFYALVPTTSDRLFVWTPLHSAAQCVHNTAKRIVTFLLDQGENFDAANQYYLTPFHYAVNYGLVEIVELLAHRGVNVHATNHFNISSLTFACTRKPDKIRFQMIKTLLSYDADVRSRSSDGKTALHVLLENRPSMQEVRAILEHGMKPDDSGTKTIEWIDYETLTLAMDHGTDMVELFLDAGVSLELEDGHTGAGLLHHTAAEKSR